MAIINNLKYLAIALFLVSITLLYAKAKVKLAKVNAENAILIDRITTQNAAIDQLQRDSKGLSDKARQAQQEADKSREKAIEIAKKTMQEKVPKDCEKAMAWMIKEAQSYPKKTGE